MTDDEPFPEPNTPEWNVMNQRRYDLMTRNVFSNPPLTAEERAELDRLQAKSLEALNRVFPSPPLPELPL
jgi:hypothetical protein